MDFFLEPLTASSPMLISGDANFSVAADDDGDFIGKSLCRTRLPNQTQAEFGLRCRW